MREFNFIGKACALHGLAVGDDQFVRGSGSEPIEFPEEIYAEDDDDVEGRIMNGIVRTGDGYVHGPTTQESLTFAELIGVAPCSLSSVLNSSPASADGFLDGALNPVKATRFDFEQCDADRLDPESVAADFHGETIGDGSPFYLSAQCKLAGAVASRESEWDIAAHVKPNRFWRLGAAIDQARYPVTHPAMEGGDQYVTKGSRVEPLANDEADFRRSVPGTFDVDVARATFAAIHSGIRVHWERKINEIPPRWMLLPPLHHRADPRRAHLMLWGRQKEFLGQGDIPAYGRNRREHFRAMHLEAAILRVIALGISGRVPLPRGEVVAAVLGTSMYYERLRASGWWWYLPSINEKQAGGRTAPLVVRVHDVPDHGAIQSMPSSLVHDPYWINSCVVDPGPERRVFVFESSNRPDTLEAYPIRFSELKWFFYIGFVIAARICDMPYFFSVDAGSGDSRVKVVPQEVFEAKGGSGLVELDASAFRMPELSTYKLPAQPKTRNLDRRGWLARDVQAYLGFDYEKRSIPSRSMATNYRQVITGSICGRHRVDAGYTIAPGRRKYYVPPQFDRDYEGCGDRDNNPIASNGRLHQLELARLENSGESPDFVFAVPARGQMSGAEFTTWLHSCQQLYYGDDLRPAGDDGKPR